MGLRPYRSASVGKTKTPIRPTQRDTVVMFPIVAGAMPHSLISSGVASCMIVPSYMSKAKPSMQIAHTVTLYAVHRSAATCGLAVSAEDKLAIECLRLNRFDPTVSLCWVEPQPVPSSLPFLIQHYPRPCEKPGSVLLRIVHPQTCLRMK